MGFFRPRIRLVRSFTWVDLLLFSALFLLVYALIGVAQEWAGPFRPTTEIDLSFKSLIAYAFFSLVRVFLAYGLSLIFTLTYGYVAAKSKIAEPILISLLDILQSVPVLGFMPGLVLALVHLIPNSNLGLELATILMIFTCEGWNMVFSFYSSLKNLPPELRELSLLLRLRTFDVLKTVEIPFAMNGLLWNSMLSMAGGWFYLMVMESFTLGDQDFRLPGIGSYVTVAYEQRDIEAIIAGIVVMFLLIVLVDRCLWAPLVAWSEKFRIDRGGEVPLTRSVVLNWLRRSRLLPAYSGWVRTVKLKWDGGDSGKRLKQRHLSPKTWQRIRLGIRLFGLGIVGLCLLLGLRGTYHLLSATTLTSWLYMFRDTLFTFFRVVAAVLLGSLWTIPLGVFIGTRPRWTRRLQPIVQIVASFPAPMLFPFITYFLIRAGITLELGAIVLMLFASQWYILFNVISGATQIPKPMLELGQVFLLPGKQMWKAVYFPAIFPSLVNGWITAAGGAWNACIVTEFVQQGEESFAATGIGASITEAAQSADFPRLAGSILIMVMTVVLLNRFFWGGLYRLAETRYRLEY